MTGNDRALLKRLVPHMRRFPGRLQGLLSQVLRVRQAYHGQTPGGNEISLTEYVANLEAELDYLESTAREIANAAKVIRGVLDGPNLEGIVDVHRILDEAANGNGEAHDEPD